MGREKFEPRWTVGVAAPDPSPAEVLAANVVLSPAQVAVVLGLVVERGARKGEPDVRLVFDLVKRAKLAPVDGTLPRSRWRFSRTLVQAYIDDPSLIVVSERAMRDRADAELAGAQ